MPLWDGGCKDSADVRPGDTLIGLDSEGKLAPQTVRSVTIVESECLEIETPEGIFVCSLSHLVARPDGSWTEAPNLVVGDALRGENGDVTVTSVSSIPPRLVYGWDCSPDHTFFSTGVLHHNLNDKLRKNLIFDIDP